MSMREAVVWPVVKLSDLGERKGWDWLTYNPGVFALFHIMGMQSAPKVARALRETFPSARSFADVGAGTGVYAARLKRSGLEVVACERSRVGRRFAAWQGVAAEDFDLTRQPPAQINRTVDLAYSFEVAEHLPPELGTRLVEFMLQLSPLVVFSAAQPGQGGHGHINLQPLSYWAAEFERAGAVLDPERTEQFRDVLRAQDDFWWIPANSQVFVGRGAA